MQIVSDRGLMPRKYRKFFEFYNKELRSKLHKEVEQTFLQRGATDDQ